MRQNVFREFPHQFSESDRLPSFGPQLIFHGCGHFCFLPHRFMNPRKKFRAIVRSSDCITADVFADDINDAWDIVAELDGSAFRTRSYSWEVEDVIPADDVSDFEPVN